MPGTVTGFLALRLMDGMSPEHVIMFEVMELISR